MELAYQTLTWSDTGGAAGGPALVLLDQTRLPNEVAYLACEEVEEVAVAIERLTVRGAPAIGVAAAYGVALTAARALKEGPARVAGRAARAVERLARTRPTAVNLFWALDQQRRVLAGGGSGAQLSGRLLDAAHRIAAEDRDLCRRIGEHGAALLRDGYTILTHCNAGSLATAGAGTALAVIYAGRDRGLHLSVYADETRPLLQGARLTAWELMQNGIDVTLFCDVMTAAVMRTRRVDCVIVGADRIAANGDVANKIGTYGVAILAREHGIPFYVAAPTSTLDLSLPSGDQIPIEERRPEEVTAGFGVATAPAGVRVYNPAFDVTPHPYVSGIITEYGVARPPYGAALSEWAANGR
ncbi:MAG: S-methyl-5-thioribose-1-phosphate isomerase [Gemmatimonadota bacterium]